MRIATAIKMHRVQIQEIVSAHHASNVRVFGSVLHGEETATSDLDLLVEPTLKMSLMDIGAIRYKLKSLLGVNVDILTPGALPDSFREKVLREAAPI